MNIAALLQSRFAEADLAMYLGGPNGFVNYGGTEDRPAKHRQGLALLGHFRIIPGRENLPDCPRCQSPMRAGIDRSRLLGWRIKCAGGHIFQPTNNTFVEQVLLKVVGADMIVWAIRSFLERIPIKTFMQDTGITSHTAVAWYKYARDVMVKVAAHDFERLGGPNDVVEVDESHLFRRKYNRGRVVEWEHVWVVGGVSRTTRHVFAAIVQRRDAETLRDLLVAHVDLRTHLCTDGWAAYRNIGQTFRRGHTTVNHRIQFLEPVRAEDPTWVPVGRYHEACLDGRWRGPPAENGLIPFRSHTQTIERCWRDLKQQIDNGKRGRYADDYVGEWIYRRNILANIDNNDRAARFERFMNDIRRAYPGVGLRLMQRDLDECDCHECYGP
ncbi:isxo2-like transposase domain [Holotrichia oblita]|uniref:Isxo2-like transposase domain n=1 Tax=Holotrichia oblita TaxID=644536 RepID=A0ACB9SLH6_HOLOL|nr:isxo2-like transposase domain [Holotrichia oblita]